MDQQTAIIGLYVAGATVLSQASTYLYEKRRDRHAERLKKKLEVIGDNVDGNLTKALNGIKDLKAENSTLTGTVTQLNRVIEKLLERNGGHIKSDG